MIPLVFHFAFFRGKVAWQWLDFHTLCLISCQRRAGAEKIIVHYDYEDTNPAWHEARRLPCIEWRKVELDWTVNGHPVSDQRIQADIYRIDTLIAEGGWFCDLDFVFLKPFLPLCDAPAVIGTQCPQKHKLACGLMGCEPGSEFMVAYRNEYAAWTPAEQKRVWEFANNIPYRLSLVHPIVVMPRKAFYPVCWSNKTFFNGKEVKLNGVYAVHLWETLHPELSVEMLRGTSLPIDEILGE